MIDTCWKPTASLPEGAAEGALFLGVPKETAVGRLKENPRPVVPAPAPALPAPAPEVRTPPPEDDPKPLPAAGASNARSDSFLAPSVTVAPRPKVPKAAKHCGGEPAVEAAASGVSVPAVLVRAVSVLTEDGLALGVERVKRLAVPTVSFLLLGVLVIVVVVVGVLSYI